MELVGEGVEFLKMRGRLASRGWPVRSTRRSGFAVKLAQAFEDQLPGVVLDEALNALFERLQVHMQAVACRGECQVILPKLRCVLEDYQEVAAQTLCSTGLIGGALFDEQGVGKTFTALGVCANKMESNPHMCVLVTCPKSVVPAWIDAAMQLLGVKVENVSGLGLIDLARLYGAGSRMFVLNYGASSESIEAFFSSGTPLVLVIDESYYVKSGNARRTQVLRKIRSISDYCLLLCGTPAPNSYRDIVSQFELMDFGLGIVNVDLDSANVLVDIARAIDERCVVFRRLKTEVLPELKTKFMLSYATQLNGSERDAYNQEMHSIETELRSLDNILWPKKRSSFLAKRASVLKGINCGFDEDVPNKLKALRRLLLKIPRGEKVVIWAHLRCALDQIESFLTEGCVRIDGSKSIKERSAAVYRFQTDDDCKFCIANPAAAGAGITLHSARHAIFYSISDRAVDVLQAVDRIHRRGQVGEVRVFFMVTEDTIEEGQIKRLLEKMEGQAELLNDDQGPLSLAEYRSVMGLS